MPEYEVVHRMIATAVDKGAPGQDKLYGWGNLNLTAAVSGNVAPTTSPTPWIAHSPSPRTAAARSNPTVAAPSPPDRGGPTPGQLAAVGGSGLFVLALVGTLVALRIRRTRGGPAGG